MKKRNTLTKLLVFAVVFVFVASMCIANVYAEDNAVGDVGTPQVVFESKDVLSGTVVTVDIEFKNLPEIKSMLVEEFVYDTDLLELVGGEWKIQNATLKDWDEENHIATAAFDENTSANGIILTLTFNVKRNCEGVSEISADDIRINKGVIEDGVEFDDETIDFEVINGTVTVRDYRRGDVNGDGAVNSNDAIHLLRFTLDADTYRINQSGDMNGDKKVNSDDAIYLLRHSLNPDKYPLYNELLVKSYAEQGYDYYTALLGNVNDNAGDLVKEARAFLEKVRTECEEEVVFTGTIDGDLIYDEESIPGYVAELLYLVSEGSSLVRDSYIDIYNAIASLCNLYDGRINDTADIYYVNPKGRVDFVTLKSLAGYKVDAVRLIEMIDGLYTDGEFIYKSASYQHVKKVYNEFEEYAEFAGFLGGDPLVWLVTNAFDLIYAEELYKLLEEAADAFDVATRVSAAYKADVFYYYDRLVADNAQLLLESDLSADTTKGLKARTAVWVADEYEKVEDILADWVADYELSEANKKAIIADKKGEGYYDGTPNQTTNTSYLSNKLTNDLLVQAYNNFKTNIAPKIIEVNGISSANVTMVQLYEEVKELYADFLILQKGSTNVGVKYPGNLTITIDSLDNVKVIIRDSGIFDKYADERIAIVFDGITSPADIKFLDLYTFETDRSILELDRITYNSIYFNAVDHDNNPATPFIITDNRANGPIYKFFVETYPAIMAATDSINYRIQALAKQDVINNNLEYIIFEGEYVAIAPMGLGKDVVSGDKTFTSSDAVYVPVASTYTNEYYDVTNKITYYENYMSTMKYTVNTTTGVVTAGTAPITVHAFKYFYPAFEALLDLDVFEADKSAKAEHLEKLFADCLTIVAELDAIPYVRTHTNGIANNVVIYSDVNGNGKYDSYVDRTTSLTPTYLVNLSDKAAVQALWDKLVAWRALGGTYATKKFSAYVENGTTYEGVYYMEGLSAADLVEVESAGEMIEKLYLQIEQLLAMVSNFKNAVSLIEKAHATNAFTATLSSDNTYNGTLYRANAGVNGVNQYAWISYTEKQIENQYQVNEGIWTGITAAGGSGVLCSNKVDTRNYDMLATEVVKSTFATKQEALEKAVALYDAFVATNVQYFGDPSNDYVTPGATLYYAMPEAISYDEIERSADSYAKFDLVSAKAYILYTFATGTTATYDAITLTFIKAIAAAETLADVEALIMSYNVESYSSRISYAEIDSLTIYPFEALREYYPY